jgi:ferredoxin
MPQITNQSTGQTAQCAAGASFHEVAENEGLGIPFGCSSGICCTCFIQIKSGKENLSAIEDQELFTLEARGSETDGSVRLACQCRVNGDLEFET